MLDFEDLRLIASLAATRSARKSADALRIHVATIYRRLAQLEARLGHPLVDRRADFAPTVVGAEMVETWNKVSRNLGELDRRLADHDGRLAGQVTITTTDSLAPLVLKAVADFAEEHRAVDVRLVVANEFSDLARREADIAIRPTVAPLDSLVGRRLADVDYAVYGDDEHLRAIVLDHTLASVPSARWWQDQLVPLTPKVFVNSMWSAAQACAAGLGRAVLPTYMEKMLSLPPREPPIEALRSSAWLLFHPESRRSPRVRAVTAALGPALATALAPA